MEPEITPEMIEAALARASGFWDTPIPQPHRFFAEIFTSMLKAAPAQSRSQIVKLLSVPSKDGFG